MTDLSQKSLNYLKRNITIANYESITRRTLILNTVSMVTRYEMIHKIYTYGKFQFCVS
jgi:hypothetical protein